MKRIILTALIGLVHALPAVAMNQCGPRDAQIATLTAKYCESLQSTGVTTAGLLMEIWASDATGTWTWIVTNPDGIACLIASGENYEARPLGVSL